jgi:DNA invertase Pin-like site-specific DNA recombinase
MKTAIYCRVSTRDKQDITTQLCYLRDYAERENLEIVEEYQDVGLSGAKDSRPDFDRMLADMRAGKFKAILTYKLDRIGRSVAHLVKLFEEFRKRQVHFISATQSINTTTPEGRMFLQILMVLAEYERELTVSRIKAGLARARKQGKPIGKRGKDKKPRRKSGYHLRWSKKSLQ